MLAISTNKDQAVILALALTYPGGELCYLYKETYFIAFYLQGAAAETQVSQNQPLENPVLI